MQRLCHAQAETPVTRVRRILMICLFATAAIAAPDIPDYASVTPSPCVTRDESIRAAWIEGQALIRNRRYPDAMALLSPILTTCPDDAATRHLAALCAWGIGQRALATRWMVQAFRQGPPEPAIAAALAAIHAGAETESVVIGWLRRGTEPLELSSRAFWITRPSFNRFWASNSPVWRDFIREMGLPTQLEVARAMGTPPVIEIAPPVQAIAEEPMLRLSPFDSKMDSLDRAAELRKIVTERLIARIRPSAELPVDLTAIDEQSPPTDLTIEEP